MKIEYPELKIKNNSPIIKGVYEIFNISYDGYLLRRPKISMIFDDMSGSKIFSGTSCNYFYRFLTRRRHYSVFNIIINVHSITILFG